MAFEKKDAVDRL